MTTFGRAEPLPGESPSAADRASIFPAYDLWDDENLHGFDPNAEPIAAEIARRAHQETYRLITESSFDLRDPELRRIYATMFANHLVDIASHYARHGSFAPEPSRRPADWPTLVPRASNWPFDDQEG